MSIEIFNIEIKQMRPIFHDALTLETNKKINIFRLQAKLFKVLEHFSEVAISQSITSDEPFNSWLTERHFMKTVEFPCVQNII